MIPDDVYKALLTETRQLSGRSFGSGEGVLKTKAAYKATADMLIFPHETS